MRDTLTLLRQDTILELLHLIHLLLVQVHILLDLLDPSPRGLLDPMLSELVLLLDLLFFCSLVETSHLPKLLQCLMDPFQLLLFLLSVLPLVLLQVLCVGSEYFLKMQLLILLFDFASQFFFDLEAGSGLETF